MASEIKMPQLSDTMDSGKILAWMKKEGDQIVRGDVLAEVETDKANLTIEAFQPGTLLKIVAGIGTTAKVGDIIAVIGAAGESVGDTSSPQKTASVSPTPQHTSLSSPSLSTHNVAPINHTTTTSSTDRIKASPLARKIAEQKNIDLTAVTGSGPNGRIIKRDVESGASSLSGGTNIAPLLETCAAAQPTPPLRAVSTSSTTATPAPIGKTSSAQPSAGQSSSSQGTFTPLSKMRETIARRMQESVTTSPHFYVTTSINMKEAMRLREILKERAEYKGISLNHLVIKAVAYALHREPRVNAAMKEGQLYTPAQINIGIITAVEDGLLIPVIKEANTLQLKDIVFEARAAVERARAGRPNANDLSGGTFSISNMGMFDVESFTAIINPGQGGILAVSSVKEVPVVEKGQIVIGAVMRVTLSVDHRIIDGVMAGTFLTYVKEALETPALMFT